ncbi:beta-galactosidase [Pseudaestuariivita atlantica]|uniref:Beta-galactosidase n=1 Tax=Pseudaestuariivita atlantica TaxID=1317121 RepID=A0A0L1JLI3_9RHOB|nr:beta-galactosidase [Pseudaestuariivita atlantica]KNG92610.1 beta-galactosidase [Pseudaestuariivita atlantica]
MKRTLGVCYYPEHWPEAQWAEDARRMAEAGLTWVRIGEFAWGRVEPREGEFDWGWLDRAIDSLGAAGLKVVLGTPTATPPYWVVAKHPDMLAIDAEGRPRKFGSRRHYCFSHQVFRVEAARITEAYAARYGANPHVAAWQTDNEYGCHDTILSYSDAARRAFRDWLRHRFQTVDALNEAWGNVFWSMDYPSFDAVDLPNLTVTEPNPAHVLAFRRFASHEVVTFNAMQAEIIRRHSDAPIAHNYMGRVTEFDHFAVGADLDIASWDSYPLGFLEDRVGADAARQAMYARQGDPDFQAFHHDLYRSVGRGRWWIMEQQPGPVNWAPVNPAPLPGMVRVWTWEAFAHGAEAVCYFRWRQAPFAQEQMHAGLLRPDSAPAPGLAEAQEVADELAGEAGAAQAPVALIFDYDADWAWAVQPHGAGLSYFGLVFDTYRALRRLGLSVDILPPDTRDFTGYAMVLAPGLMHVPDALKTALAAAEGQVIVGPRAAARDGHMAIPVPLPPSLPGLEVTVTHVETIREDTPRPVTGAVEGRAIRYVEALDGAATPLLTDETGGTVAVASGGLCYLGAWLDEDTLVSFLETRAHKAGLATTRLPGGLRCRDTGTERFWINYDATPHDTPDGPVDGPGVLRVPLR